VSIFSSLGMLLGGSWASGINLYLTIAVLGIADRVGIINLPGGLEVLAHPLVIVVAVLLFLVEFFADKVPYVDSAWDSFHTVIRPVGAGILAYMGTSGSDHGVQLPWRFFAGLLPWTRILPKPPLEWP